MKTPQVLQDLLDKPMTRQEFLRHVGVGSLLLMGGGMIVNSLGGFEKLVGRPAKQQTVFGYGASAYGGKQTRS